MNIAETHSASFQELLNSIDATLSDNTRSPADLRSASERLMSACGAFEEADDEEWKACARVTADLLEIAACSFESAMSSGDSASGANVQDEEITTFLRRSIAKMKDVFAHPSSNDTGEFVELVDEADRHWREHLDLLSEERLWHRGAMCSGAGDDACQPLDDSGVVIPPSGDLHRILKTLAGQAVTSHDTQTTADNGKHRSPAHMFDRSVLGPPQAPEVIDQPRLDQGLLDAYLEDAAQCLAAIEQAALRFEQNPAENSIVPMLCRELHTLKGASASVGLSTLGSYLHEMEEWIESVAKNSGTLRLDPVLQCVDAVRHQIAALRGSEFSSESPSVVTPLVSAPLDPNPSRAPLAEAFAGSNEETVRVKAAQLDRLMDLLAELVMLRNRRDGRVAVLDQIQDELSRCVLRLQSLSEGDSRLRPSTRPGDSHIVRSHVTSSRPRSEVSEVVDDLREIVRSVRQIRQPIADEDRAISQFIGQFRQELVGLRRTPLSGLFRRLQRVARDAAQVEAKRVRLQFVGEHAGLERSLQERLYEPLLHMIRNAVSHGIETEEDRVRVGKDPVGTITLEALGSSNLLVFEVQDDGRGLDYDAIRRRGLERGLIPTDRPASERELSRLIFQPGFSTRDSSNQVSGRGIGMDVVATTLERLHCLIDVESMPGKGTTFRLTMPLRSVIEHTLVFRCGHQCFGVPIQFVHTASRSRQEMLGDGPGAHTDNLPVLSARSLLGLPPGDDETGKRWLILGHRQMTRSSDVPAPESRGSSTRRREFQRVALSVDEIVGHEEVVVRPLPSLLKHHPLLSGTTLSGSGDVMLLMDGHRLLRACVADSKTEAQAIDHREAGELRHNSGARPRVLVVDDSLSARMRLVEKLKRRELSITEAGDGVDALDLLRTDHFDAIFSDLEMPRMGGFELLAEVKSDSARHGVPVVIVTTRADEATRRKARELKADGFLTKPVTDRALGDLLKRIALRTNTSS